MYVVNVNVLMHGIYVGNDPLWLFLRFPLSHKLTIRLFTMNKWYYNTYVEFCIDGYSVLY